MESTSRSWKSNQTTNKQRQLQMLLGVSYCSNEYLIKHKGKTKMNNHNEIKRKQKLIKEVMSTKKKSTQMNKLNTSKVDKKEIIVFTTQDIKNLFTDFLRYLK
jgi:hypothetical protein